MPLANIYGDLVIDINARTLMVCLKCGKLKYSKKYIKAPLNYNALNIFNYMKQIASSKDNILHDYYNQFVIQDKSLYEFTINLWEEYYGKNNRCR